MIQYKINGIYYRNDHHSKSSLHHHNSYIFPPDENSQGRHSSTLGWLSPQWPSALVFYNKALSPQPLDPLYNVYFSNATEYIVCRIFQCSFYELICSWSKANFCFSWATDVNFYDNDTNSSIISLSFNCYSKLSEQNILSAYNKYCRNLFFKNKSFLGFQLSKLTSFLSSLPPFLFFPSFIFPFLSFFVFLFFSSL